MRSGEHLLEVDRQRADRHLFARHADQHASAVWMCQLIGELDYRLRAGSLDLLIGTFCPDDLTDRTVQIAGRSGIQTMRRPARPRHLELAINEIDGDDRDRASELSELNDVEADSAHPEHDD